VGSLGAGMVTAWATPRSPSIGAIAGALTATRLTPGPAITASLWSSEVAVICLSATKPPSRSFAR
jgi:hypothetical protein